MFGGFRVLAPDGSDALPHGRKARALLAYLLLSGDEAVPRERLAGLLWGERGEEQSRASVRQTLYEMRLLSTGDRPLLILERAHVRIAPGRVTSDLDRLRACARAGDAASLAALIGDRPRELLDDLDNTEAAFDAWLANERVRRRDERRSAVLDVAAQALAQGDAEGAQRLANCLLAVDPLDESAACLAMNANHERGDRDGVRLVYARLVAALEQDLGVAPAEETSAIHRRLMASPIAMPAERATARAERVGPGDQAVSPTPPASDVRLPVSPRPASATPGFAARGVTRRRLAAAAFVVLVLGVGASLVGLRPAAGGARHRLLQVQPLLVASDDIAALTLRKGLSTELARLLVGNDATLIVSDPGRPAGRVDESDRFTVTGDAQSHAGMLRVDIKLLSAGNDAILWSSSFSRPANEVDALGEQIASKLADVTRCALGGRNPGLDELGLETLRLFLGACEQKHDDWAESAKLLAQVVQRRPAFAHAWAMLAAGTASAASQGSVDDAALFAQAQVYAQHALALDPAEGDAYYARAESLPAMSQWKQRMDILQAGDAADPGNSPINEMLAWNLAIVDRWREAIGHAQRAQAFDPFSPGATSLLAQLLGYGTFSPDANRMLQRTRTRFPTIDFAVKNEFFIAANAGDPRHAAALLDDATHPLHLLPEREALWRTVVAARIDASAARVDAAVRAVLASSSRPHQSGAPVVEKLVILNRLDQAYAFADQLTRADLDDSDTTIFFRSDMAPFRADHRFMSVALRFGLLPIWSQTGRWPDFCGDGSVPYDCRVEARHAMSASASASASAPPSVKAN